jgi:hypothetical protein
MLMAMPMIPKIATADTLAMFTIVNANRGLFSETVVMNQLIMKTPVRAVQRQHHRKGL